MNNPYDLIKDAAKLQHYEYLLGIENYKIFETVLTNNKKIDRILGFAVSRVSGGVDPSGVLGWVNIQSIRNDSQDFLLEQITRLRNNPTRFDNELSINLLAFACMAFRLDQAINMNNRMSDVGHIFVGLFSSKKAMEWVESLWRRSKEVVRWSYSSSILLIIYYIILCKDHCRPYYLPKLKSAAQHIGQLYVSCDDVAECIITSYKDLISSKYQYIHDILLEYTQPISLYDTTIEYNENLKKVFNYYISRDDRTQILNKIEELTIKR